MTKNKIFSLYGGTPDLKIRITENKKSFEREFVGILDNSVFYRNPFSHKDTPINMSQNISDCSLILKPISGMSDKDRKEFAKIDSETDFPIAKINAFDNGDYDVIYEAKDVDGRPYAGWSTIRFGNLNSKKFLWLIQHGFALNDEWFTNGIAVNK